MISLAKSYCFNHCESSNLMSLFTLDELRSQLPLIHQTVNPTPCRQWPLLAKHCGVDVWVKHENHNPTGAFKVRGGLVYMNNIEQNAPACQGVVSATRGNHGQSIALAASRNELPAVIVVPEGNSVEKNAAMEAFGAELVIAGKDFDAARKVAAAIGQERNLHMIPSFHRDLVLGVASYALEMFETAGELDTVYVPIGMGSGICGVITVRDLLGLKTEVVGVVSSHATAVKQSFENGVGGKIVTTETANTFADGMACRDPNPEAMEIIRHGASRIVSVSDDEVAQAQRLYFSETHNLAEGAGAASLAALLQESKGEGLRTASESSASPEPGKARSVGLVLSGSNIDSDKFAAVLAGQTPAP